MHKMLKSLLPVVLVLTGSLCLCGFDDISLRDIETAVLEEDFEKVTALSQQFLLSDPPQQQLNEARYFLGLGQLYLAEYREARRTFSEVLARDPDRTLRDRAALGVVDSYYMDGDYPEALRMAEQLFPGTPAPEVASLVDLKLARIHLKLTRWAEARRYLNKIIQNYPRSPEYHTARQLLEEKQFFAVQVGAFMDQGRAVALMDRLQASGEYAYIIETVDGAGTRFYRVRVGQFATPAEAEQLRHKLAETGYPTLIYP